MDAWRLDASIDHRDALIPLKQAAGQIGSQVGFAGASAEGVDRDDSGQAAVSPCTSFDVECLHAYSTPLIVA